MRRCPRCNREFEDDLQFCLDDGTALVGVRTPQTVASSTLVLRPGGDPPPTLPQAVRPDVPALPRLATTRSSTGAGSTAGSSAAAIIIGILLCVVLILCFAGFGLWGIVFARRTPMVLLCIAGMALAVLRAKRHPTASFMAGFGLSIYLFSSLIFTAATYDLAKMAYAVNVPYTTLYIVFSVLDYFGGALAIVLLVAAAFVGRKSRSAVNN